ncbi:MAG: SusC/RagA family TonB-linked outer membrane protein [Bacteroidetes bacterium]|nr:SusC/RagA family TonB-linked outer membrane protein [Bacteroidota bacterium]
MFRLLLNERQVNVSWQPNHPDTSLLITMPPSCSVDEALDIIATQTDLDWERIGKTINFKRKKPLCYIVVSNNREGRLPGATIYVLHTRRRLLTDRMGTVTVALEDPPMTIVATHVNMRPDTLTITRPGLVDIWLKEETTSMAEAVISTGYVYSRSPIHVPANRSDLSGFQLGTVSTGSPLSILEGQEPGLIVTQTNGNSTAGFNINIHGQNSLFNSQEPLYIVDNVVVASGNTSMSGLTPGISAGSQSPFSYFNPEDIEHIEVLKDAEATAIYGSRGANGVVIITTRRAKNGRPRFDLQLSSGIAHTSTHLPLMNTEQYLAMRNEAFKNDNATPNAFNAPDLKVWDSKRYTDWQKFMMGDASHIYNFQTSLTGGSPGFNYYAGVGGLQESSVYPTHPLHRRLNADVNLGHQSKDHKLDIRVDGLFGWDWNHQFIYSDPAWMQFIAPNAPTNLKNAQGGLNFQSDGASFLNPYIFLGQPASSKAHNTLLDGSASYHISSSLTARFNIGWNEVASNEFGATPIGVQDASGPIPPFGISYFANTRYRSQIIEPQLEYNQTWGRWQVGLLAGASWQQQSSRFSDLTAIGFTSDNDLRNPALAQVQMADSVPTINSSYRAQFGRLSTMLDSTYVLNVSYRRDGSDRLNPKMYFGNFYSIGGAWIFSQAGFMRNHLPFINLARLRGSYGITGSDQIGTALSTTNGYGGSIIQNYYTSPIVSRVNEGATWERMQKLEAGLDLAFYKNRIKLGVVWYQNRSTNQLIPTSLPRADSSIIFRNWPAVLLNRGWDVTLSIKPVETKNFTWTTTFNWSFPVTRLERFDSLSHTILARQLVVGESPNVAQGFRYQGVDPTTGLYKFADLNHDGMINDSDRTVFGHYDISSFGGLDNIFRYKNFQLEVLFDARIAKGVSYLVGLYQMTPPGSFDGQNSNTATGFENRWKNAGDKARYQRVTTATTYNPTDNPQAVAAFNNYVQSDAMLANASFVRLRKAEFSYRLPYATSARIYLSDVKFFLIGQNLFTLSPYKGVSPELQNAALLPILRTIEMGLHVTF